MNDRTDMWMKRGALISFVVAALTGFVFRSQMAGWLDTGLLPVNIRHAHSHLMFFGWASLLPLWLFRKNMRQKDKAVCSTFCDVGMWLILSSGLIAWLSFLFFGYRPVAVGSALIPISVILSGMVMIGWYLFMVGYIRYRMKGGVSLGHWAETALVMLFICSLAAWAVGPVSVLFPESELLAKAFTHLFLSVFTEGWVVLSLLYMIEKIFLKHCSGSFGTRISSMIAIGAPLTFAEPLLVYDASAMMNFAAKAGGLLTAFALLVWMNQVRRILKRIPFLLILLMIYLSIKAVMQILNSSGLLNGDRIGHNLEILYLHILLLGAYTSAAFIVMHQYKPGKKWSLYMVLLSFAMVILSLVLLTPIWPSEWYITAGYDLVTAIAILPAISVLIWIISNAKRRQGEAHDLSLTKDVT